MEAKYFTVPTPPKAVGHEGEVSLENLVRKKKNKEPGTVESRTHGADLEVLEVKVWESQRRAFSSGTLEGYELSLHKY